MCFTFEKGESRDFVTAPSDKKCAERPYFSAKRQAVLFEKHSFQTKNVLIEEVRQVMQLLFIPHAG